MRKKPSVLPSHSRTIRPNCVSWENVPLVSDAPHCQTLMQFYLRTSHRDHFLKSIAFLQNASAVPYAQALKILGQFGDAFKAEVDSFSGSHSLREVEHLVNELTQVPDVMRTFFGRTPVVKPLETKALQAIKDMVCGYYRQLRESIARPSQSQSKCSSCSGLFARRK